MNTISGRSDFDTGNLFFDCQRCGKFSMTEEFCEEYPRLSNVNWLSNATRQASEAGRPLLLTLKTYQQLIEEHRSTGLQENIEKVLNYIHQRCSRPGRTVTFEQNNDYTVIDAQDRAELLFYLNHLHETGLINKSGPQVELTAKGIQALTGPLGGGFVPGRCFVAMSFADDLKPAYLNGIRPAIIDAGYDPVCMWELLTNEDICYRLSVEIRKAELVVADFTNHRGGVYFEAGFAVALRREIFWTCRADHFAELHFDTNHYQHIKWATPEDLRTQLTEKIVAVAGRGPRGLGRRASAPKDMR
jgi:hypothetical protein